MQGYGAGFFGAGGNPIKAIYRGTIALANGVASNTATITAVVTANSSVRIVGVTYDTGAELVTDHFEADVTLTNTTTVTASRQGTNNGLTVSYEVTEYVSGFIRQVQRFTIALVAAATNTSTLTSTTTSQTELSTLGQLNNIGGNQNGQDYKTRLELTNATTVTATKGNNTAAKTVTIRGQALEWAA